MTPEFAPGPNIAIKVPAHEYEATVSFYRDILGLRPIPGTAPSASESVRFEFGDKTLWIDRVPTLSQAEIWLELTTNDIDAATRHLNAHGCPRRDGIEPLPPDFPGFWISSPANIIHLITTHPSP